MGRRQPGPAVFFRNIEPENADPGKPLPQGIGQNAPLFQGGGRELLDQFFIVLKNPFGHRFEHGQAEGIELSPVENIRIEFLEYSLPGLFFRHEPSQI